MLSTDEKLILALASAAVLVTELVAADAQKNFERLVVEYGEPTLQEQLDIIDVVISNVDEQCPLKLRHKYLKDLDMIRREIARTIKHDKK